jgi:hypothetical protein
MWLTQSYLSGPREDFPLYLYLVFSRYVAWNSDPMGRLRELMSIYGRQTQEKVATLLPNDKVDQDNIADEFAEHHRVLGHKISPSVRFGGLLFLNRRLEDTLPDGSDSRWALVPFSEGLTLGSSSIKLSDFLQAIESPGEDDPVQHVLRVALKQAKQPSDVLEAVSLSAAVVPSINLGKLRTALADKLHAVTNIYD